jgi:hypothetical protein
MPFADCVAIPIRNVNDKVAGAVGHALATQSAVGRETRSEREFFFFAIAHFGDGVEAFLNDAVTRRAGADTSARMIELDAVGQSNIEDTAGQSGVSVRNLFRIDIDGYVHRHERDGEFLRRRSRRFLVDVRVRSAHTTMVTLFDRGKLHENGLDGRPVRSLFAYILPDNPSFFVHDKH